jgi:hypothetical protein
MQVKRSLCQGIDALPQQNQRPPCCIVYSRTLQEWTWAQLKYTLSVPADRDPQSVRCFPTFTTDLHAAADWLELCRIDTVAMESTDVYWIPFFQILESRGFKVFLGDARHVKNVPSRKTDVEDCQWLQYLHTRWVYYEHLFGQNKPYAMCVRFSATATAWFRWPPFTSNTCKSAGPNESSTQTPGLFTSSWIT